MKRLHTRKQVGDDAVQQRLDDNEEVGTGPVETEASVTGKQTAPHESAPVEKGVYRHNKTGNLYEVIGSALHTETDDLLVAYRPLNGKKHNADIFVRPYEMFTELVVIGGQKVPRFEKVDTPRTFIA